MSEANSLLLTFLREAWIALAGAFLAFALLAGIAQILRVSSAGLIGETCGSRSPCPHWRPSSCWDCLPIWAFRRS